MDQEETSLNPNYKKHGNKRQQINKIGVCSLVFISQKYQKCKQHY
jgi:hypothetical protein